MNLRRIAVENFGPIKKGSIDLRPLTILIGSSNSGKSYMSTLIYSVSSLETSRGLFRYQAKSDLRARIGKELRALMRDNRGNNTFEMPMEMAQRMYKLVIDGMFGDHLKQNLERNFRTHAENLARNDTESASVKVSTFTDLVVDLNANIKPYKIPLPDTKYLFEVSDNASSIHAAKTESEWIIKIGKKSMQEFPSRGADLVIGMMHGELFKKDAVPSLDSYYFPASRSGILETYPEATASIMEDFSYSVFANDDDNPRIGGIITDFITPLILLKRKKCHFSNWPKRWRRVC